jgi:Antitoxin VbhA
MAAQVQPVPTSQIVNMEERRRIIDSALGTTLAEGVSPGPEVLAISERYVSGEITLQQMGSLVRAMSGL